MRYTENIVEKLLKAALYECCEPDDADTIISACMFEAVKKHAIEDIETSQKKDTSASIDLVILAQTSTSYAAVLHYRLAHHIFFECVDISTYKKEFDAPLPLSDQIVLQMHRIIAQKHNQAANIYGACGIADSNSKINHNDQLKKDVTKQNIEIPLTHDFDIASHVAFPTKLIATVSYDPHNIQYITENEAYEMASQCMLFSKADMIIDKALDINDQPVICILLQGMAWEIMLLQRASQRKIKIIILHQGNLPSWFLQYCTNNGYFDASCFDGRDFGHRLEIFNYCSDQSINIIISTASDQLLQTSCDLLAQSGEIIIIDSDHYPNHFNIYNKLADKNAGLNFFNFEHYATYAPIKVKKIIHKIWNEFLNRNLKPIALKSIVIGELENEWNNQQDDPCPINIHLQNEIIALHAKMRIPPIFSTDGIYVVTGGFGGFGSKFAEWMIDEGAKAICLIGRKGANTEASKALIKTLEEKGAFILEMACDVSNYEATKQCLSAIRANSPYPIKGIIHAATLLDDHFLLDMTEDAFVKVMGPKACGALFLHSLTQEDPIDVFINFSSISSMVGQVGQCNYAAANGVLDTLALHRKASGQAALSINWGAIGGVGIVAEDNKLRDHLLKLGIRMVDYKLGMSLIPYLIAKKHTNIGVMDVDWDSNLGFLLSPRYSNLVVQTQMGLTEKAESLKALQPNERMNALQSMLLEEIGRVLSILPDKVPLDIALTEAGVDSLSAVEIQTAIRVVFGVNLSQIEVMASDNIELICQTILDRLSFT